jgi:hypothetical protein
VFIHIAQLRCAIELAAATPETAARPTPVEARPANAVDHAFEYVDALMGTPLSERDVVGLEPVAVGPDGAPLPVLDGSTAVEGNVVRRTVLMPRGDTYGVRVDGVGSLRYFGCAAQLPAQGEGPRRVRVALVPRARDIALRVEVHRDDGHRNVPTWALGRLELRADAASERELEVHPGRCSGERPDRGRSWCVRSLAAAPSPMGLTLRVPEYGLARVALASAAPERTVEVTARVEGHLLPEAVPRVTALVGVVNGAGVGAQASLDVIPSLRTLAGTCPMSDTCVRPLVHIAAGAIPYARDVNFLGPGNSVVADGSVSGLIAFGEVGGGVTVVPGGTGDRLRFSTSVSAALGWRGDEVHPANGGLLLSAESARMGVGYEARVGYRFAGIFVVDAGLRMLVFPAFGSRGREFSYLGAAGASSQSASLLQVAALIGFGVEP